MTGEINSRNIARFLLAPTPLTSRERRWLRKITNIVANAAIGIVLLAAITMFIIVTNQDVAAWFWENVFSRPWWPMPPTPK